MPISETAARKALQTLLEDYHKLTETDRKNMSEASVVRQFIDRLLEEVLGWPIKDPARYKYELHTQAGRPDLTLFPENGGTVFVEAKRFGIIKELEQARYTIAGTIQPGQLALPGMAVDRTDEEQQAINYAFANGGTWAILTNFEKLRLFNARRDWLVLSFESPSAYLQDFDWLWQLAYHNVVNGSLDAMSNQRHTEEVDTDYLSFINEWRERLARDVLTRRAANPWVNRTDGTVDLPLLRAVVQRFLDRLVVVRFAEDHLVIPPGTLRGFYDLGRNNIYFSMDQTLDTFFQRFNENHNSALFAHDVVDDASFSDEVLIPLLGKLYEARYRAMPADILGNTYEQYLGKALILDNGTVTTRDNLETRKKQGSYYTPQVIVRHIVENSLGRYLYGTENGRPDGTPIEGESRKTSQDIRNLRVLDSACGSGSFLIYAYYVLADFYESEIARLEVAGEKRRQELAEQGVTSPLDLQIQLTHYTSEIERIRDYPRIILEAHLYGVDLDPQAAEIATVNLMMRGMERRGREKRLPLILNQNVKVGNALVGLRPDDPRLADHPAALADLLRLRLALVRTPNGPEHDRIIADLQASTTALSTELDADFAEHFTDVERVRPFHWGVEFPEAFYNPDGSLKDNPGFAVIFGNPPWEIIKPDLREFYAQFDPDIESRMNRAQVEKRIEELNETDPRLVDRWQAQVALTGQTAAYFRQAPDFSRQGRGDTATHKLFAERMWTLLADTGRLGYVVPSGIYTDLGTKDLRLMLLDEGHIEYLFGFSNERFFFPGVHHAFRFALLGAQKGVSGERFWTTFRINPRVAITPDELPTFLADESNLVYVHNGVLPKFSPDSLRMIEFQSAKDYVILEAIYNDWPLIGDAVDVWNIEFAREFDVTMDRELFNRQKKGTPIYEGKYIHQYNPSYGFPEIYIELINLQDYLSKRGFAQDRLTKYGLVFREIAQNTNERTFIATILPPKTMTTYTLRVDTDSPNDIKLYTLGIFNSFVFDYCSRFQTNLHLSTTYKSLPLPRLTSGNPYFDAIVPRAARLTCTRPEFADLWQQVMGEPWKEASGVTDVDERQQLRDELDALVAHLYGLSRDDFDHILGTFPLVFPDNEADQAKRAALLTVYDEWAGKLG